VIGLRSIINTGAKYDTKAFKEVSRLNGVGTKAVNALSSYFKVESIRDEQIKQAEFEGGNLKKDYSCRQSNGAQGKRRLHSSRMKRCSTITNTGCSMWNGCFGTMLILIPGLRSTSTVRNFFSENGLSDLAEGEHVGRAALSHHPH